MPKTPKKAPPYVTPDNKPDYVIFVPGNTLDEALLACDDHRCAHPNGRHIYMWENPDARFDHKGRVISEAFSQSSGHAFITASEKRHGALNKAGVHYDTYPEDAVRGLNKELPFDGTTLTLSEGIHGLSTFVYRPLPHDLAPDLRELFGKQTLSGPVDRRIKAILSDPICAKAGQVAIIISSQCPEQANPHGWPDSSHADPADRDFYNNKRRLYTARVWGLYRRPETPSLAACEPGQM